MKKLLLTLFAVLTASFAFAGDGTKDNPYTVADVLAAQMDSSVVYVKAYIVGSCTGSAISSAEFGVSDKSSASNILLADSQGETSTDNVIAAQLPTAVREGLALKNVPGNYGKMALLKAQLIKYFGRNGIKNVTEYELSGEGIDPGEGGGGGEEEKPDFSQYEEISVAQFLEKKDTQTKYKLTGIVGSIKNTTYGNFDLIDIDNEDVSVYVYGLVDYKGTKKIWGTLDPKIEEKDTITVVGSYTLYNNTTDEIVDAIYVEHKKYTGEKVSIKNTPETAYTVAKVKELVDAGEGLSDEVYVKGIISSITSVAPAGSATYFIKDNQEDELSVQVYKGNYLENHPFDTTNDIKVGDEVIIYGLITLYQDIYEINAGNYIYSLNGETKYTQKELNDISNTPETAYTTSEATALINSGESDLTKHVYVKGIVSEIKSLDPTQYTRAQYYISEDGTTENQFYIYNGFYLEGKEFTSTDQLKVGDQVIIYGLLTVYSGEPQMAQNNKLYSINGVTDGISNIEVAKSGVIYDLAGRRVEKATKGIYIINGKKVVK